MRISAQYLRIRGMPTFQQTSSVGPSATGQDPRGGQLGFQLNTCTDKKENQISPYIRKFRVEQVQSHI
jgi:hypothetical protein